MRCVLTCLVLLVSLALPVSAQTTQRPDVLFIVIDDLGWEEFQFLPLTNLHAAANEGRAYQRFYTSTVCSPSRYQMLYGRYPHDAFIGKALVTTSSNEKGAPTHHLSLPERLVADGYRTALFGKWHVTAAGDGTLADAARVHGFENWLAGAPGNIEEPSSHYDWRSYNDGVMKVETTYTSLAIESAFHAWWTTTQGPRFAVCSFLAPHEPFQFAPPELTVGFPLKNTPRGRYESAVVALDTILGWMRTYVDFSNTYVFLFPDNGTPHQVPPPTHLNTGYKTTVYEGGVRVPLFVWGPGVFPGTDQSLVQICDLPRTVLDLAGLQATHGFDASISFARTIYGGPNARMHAFTQRFVPHGGAASTLTLHNWALVRKDGWKLMRTGTVLRLYDLFQDPYEKTPIPLVSQPALVQQMMSTVADTLGPNWPYTY
jgi:arylsulfatase A-like enzyme